MKIYTKTGDAGATGLIGGTRVSKDHPRIEAYGTVDELNAALGSARTHCDNGDLDQLLERAQNELFAVGAELAASESGQENSTWIGPCHVEYLEKAIDKHETNLQPLSQFILPAGNPATASLHLARAICRRAERRVVTLSNLDGETVSVSSDLVIYLNRLGDLLFVLARVATSMAGLQDTPWQKPENR